MPVDVAKLVAVKAEEWQRRASKVMSQAKPQLDVVRELFEEGQELGYEESIQGVCVCHVFLACIFIFIGLVAVRFAFFPLRRCSVFSCGISSVLLPLLRCVLFWVGVRPSSSFFLCFVDRSAVVLS